MSKYIAIPWVLYTRCDTATTTVDMFEKWADYKHAVNNDVQAHVSDSEHDAATAMLDDALRFIKSFPDVADGLMPVSNFRLRYNVNPIGAGGRVWVGDYAVRHHTFTA